MMRERAVVIFELDGVQGFDGLRRLLMEDLAALPQYCPVGHLLRQRMLEDVFHLRKRGLLVQKFLVLQRGQQPIQVSFRLRNDLPRQAQWKFAPNDGELLQ